MARPQILQELRHGKLLTKENFPQFVDTFNYTVTRLENLKGDADVRPNGGWVTVDNSDPEHPVIRLRNTPISPSLSAVVSGDTEVVGARKSIDLVDEQGSDPYYQLHNFQTSVESGPDTYLRFEDQPTLTGADFSIGC